MNSDLKLDLLKGEWICRLLAKGRSRRYQIRKGAGDMN